MKLRFKIAYGFIILLVVSVTLLAVALSFNSKCGPAPGIAADAKLMKAVVYRCYGSPDVLKIEDVVKPSVTDEGILIKIRSASVNPLDWHYMRGSPYIMRMQLGLGAPKRSRLGVDFAGTVETIGRNVSQFKPGDEVFGGASGAFAEYIVMPETASVIRKPANITFEQSAATGIAGITALQALRDHGKLKAGEKVLINGASGGVGTFAVQIAKSFDAEVTGVCSTKNLDLVRSLGADHVIDYTRDNYTAGDERYDLIIDMVGNHSVRVNSRVLKPDGRLIVIGARKGDWIRPLRGVIESLLLSPFIKKEVKFFVAQFSKEDLSTLAELMQEGKVTPVIDRHYPLNETAAAVRYSETGRARGKIIINMD